MSKLQSLTPIHTILIEQWLVELCLWLGCSLIFINMQVQSAMTTETRRVTGKPAHGAHSASTVSTMPHSEVGNSQVSNLEDELKFTEKQLVHTKQFLTAHDPRALQVDDVCMSSLAACPFLLFSPVPVHHVVILHLVFLYMR